MFCHKTGGECHHKIVVDPNYIFVLMPFAEFDSVYDIVQQSIREVDNDYLCERADAKYSTFSIWCQQICQNIQKANYLIVDTTGKNPNVFYELGFAHGISKKKIIIITQKIEEAPFDIRDMGHIIYSSTKLPELRKKLIIAINELKDVDQVNAETKLIETEEVIDLKMKLGQSEREVGELQESLKQANERIVAIRMNPQEEALIEKDNLEKRIDELEKRVFSVSNDPEESRILQEKKDVLKQLDDNMETSKKLNDNEPLISLLLQTQNTVIEGIRLIEKGNREVGKGNYGIAINDFSKSISTGMESSSAFIGRGVAYSNIKRYSEAIDDFTKALEMASDSYHAIYFRALCLHHLKQYKKAIQGFTSAIKCNPHAFEPYTGRGSAYHMINNFKQSIKDHSTAIRLKPNNGLAYFNRGNSYMKLEKEDLALADYNKSLELNTQSAHVYYNRANLYLNQEKYEKAINDLNHVINLEPKNYKAYASRGINYSRIKEFKNAINDFTHALEIDKRGYEALVNRAFALIELEEYEKALDDFNKAIEIDPTNNAPYFGRVNHYIRIGDYQAAISDFETILDMEKDNIDAIIALAELFLVSSEYRKCEEKLETISTRIENTKYEPIYCLLDLICSIVSKREKSVSINKFEKVMKGNPIIDWSLKELKKWLQESELSKEQKSEIYQLFEVLSLSEKN
ncbi:tetratricopeptide repeat protein [bacterium]|nr:tetratricopeptide repeat protein [bacterium]